MALYKCIIITIIIIIMAITAFKVIQDHLIGTDRKHMYDSHQSLILAYLLPCALHVMADYVKFSLATAVASL